MILQIIFGRFHLMKKQQTELGMKWYHFLIYFVLWLNAFSCIVNGYTYLYDIAMALLTGHSEILADPLAIAQLIMGIFYVGFAIFCLVTRSHLARFKAGAPKKLYAFYLLGLIPILLLFATLFLTSGVDGVIQYITDPELGGASMIGSIIGTFVALAINKVYFGKREHLFVN